MSYVIVDPLDRTVVCYPQGDRMVIDCKEAALQQAVILSANNAGTYCVENHYSHSNQYYSRAYLDYKNRTKIRTVKML